MKKKDEKKVFPCPLCQKELEIKISKKQKPYCVCIDCGIQLFIRGKEGISRLAKKTGFELDRFEILESGQRAQALTQPKRELLKEKIERDELDEWLESQ